MTLGEGDATSGGRADRSLSFMSKVLFNGNLLGGKACSSQLGFEPGNAFEIKLIPLGSGEENEIATADA